MLRIKRLKISLAIYTDVLGIFLRFFEKIFILAPKTNDKQLAPNRHTPPAAGYAG